jgi:hypothetical protein
LKFYQVEARAVHQAATTITVLAELVAIIHQKQLLNPQMALQMVQYTLYVQQAHLHVVAAVHVI